ncbi:MAG: sodium-translocating pyrophosphatase [Chloroflexi bacterium]|nr:sodium-translocating pyrophosphatase [Chloroflexota bacterium]MBI3742524.1 sodium-translocating pyrophosphatase [Chloroflexota bacterium]
MSLLWIVPVSGILGLLFVAYLAWDVLRRDTGTKEMQAVAATIYEGALAFIKRQYLTIAILAIVTGVVIGILVGAFETFSETGVVGAELGIKTAVAFLVGAAASALSGIIGMYVAVKSNVRVASAARAGVAPALAVALRGGAVSGFLVVGLSLIGVYIMFNAYGGATRPEFAPFLIVGMGFGASFVALFAQLGGGIYTKAADVGSDLVGKVEAGIPEDDPRNAGVIADLVGDNVGDCAGRGADLFESTVAENIGAMILGVAIFMVTKNPDWIFFPLVVRAFGLIASIVGVWATTSLPAIRLNANENPMNPMLRGFALTIGLAGAAMYFVVTQLLQNANFFYAGLVGLATSVAFFLITMYYTEARWRPVRSIANASLRGAGPNIITGLAVGFENTAAPVIAVGVALIASFFLGTQAASALNVAPYVAGVFGTAVATMGMLMPAAFILAMDTFGPIVDNAGGIVEMSGAPEEIRQGTDALDAAGNTTKALTKGYAIGSAALAAFLLFSAYLDKVAAVRQAIQKVAADSAAGKLIYEAAHRVDIGKVEVFVGAMLGAALIFLFSSFAIRAVSEVAEKIIEEVRRQFREHPGIMKNTEKPDYARAVDITARGALRAMVAPGLLAVGAPIVVGVLLKAEAEAALLMVGTIAGIILATVMNNGGGAWDNAKKFIESGEFRDEKGAVHAKKSDAHKAAVVGDTVGDPFKDTAGPSVHVLIKLLSTITLVLAPLFI